MSIRPLGSLARRPRFLLLGVSRSRVAHPPPILVRRAPCLQSLTIARTIPLHHRRKLIPVNGSEIIVLSGCIPLQRGIRNLEAEEFGLGGGDVNELLPQLVIGETLDFPTHGLRRMLGVPVARAKHHD